MTNEGQNSWDMANEEYVLPFIKELIKTPSLSGQEKDVANLIKKKMQELEFDEITIDDMGNVIGKIEGKNHNKKIFFNGHIDHVHPGNQSAWKNDPYSGLIKDGKLYGRGSVDMKGSVGCAVLGLGLLKMMNLVPENDIYFMGVVHEETREGTAFEHLFNKYGTPDACVIGEATNLDINIGHRGRAEIVIETLGSTGHSGMPHLADNAVYKLAPVIKAISEINESLPSHDFVGKATASIIYLSASPNLATAIPDKAWIVIDRRMIPGETKESLLTEIEEYLQKNGISINEDWINVKLKTHELECWTGKQVTTKAFMPAWVLEKEHPLVQDSVESLKKIGLNPKMKRWEFSTDGNFSMGERNVPTIGFGPGDERIAHQPNEYVPINDLIQAVKGNAQLALNLKDIQSYK